MITKEKFLKYKKVRQSGITNMFDMRTVRYLTDLSKEEVLEIMEKYSDLEEKYINER